MLSTQGDLEAKFVLTVCSLPLHCVPQVEIQQKHDIPLKRFDGNLRTECNMGNDGKQTGSDSASGLALLGILIAGLAFFHDWDTRKESNQWREEDTKSAEAAEFKEEVRYGDLSKEVKNIQKNVAQTVPRRLPQPLVLASDMFDQQFDFGAKASTGSAFIECNRPVLTVTNFGDYAALDVSVVWMIDGLPITVAVPHKALRVNEEITSAIVPKLKSNTKVKGFLKIEFGDSSGFRGVVKHPVSIRVCEGHVHLTIEPHDSQTWQAPSSSIYTN